MLLCCSIPSCGVYDDDGAQCREVDDEDETIPVMDSVGGRGSVERAWTKTQGNGEMYTRENFFSRLTQKDIYSNAKSKTPNVITWRNKRLTMASLAFRGPRTDLIAPNFLPDHKKRMKKR